jgi:hypothetical protein
MANVLDVVALVEQGGDDAVSLASPLASDEHMIVVAEPVEVIDLDEALLILPGSELEGQDGPADRAGEGEPPAPEQLLADAPVDAAAIRDARVLAIVDNIYICICTYAPVHFPLQMPT